MKKNTHLLLSLIIFSSCSLPIVVGGIDLSIPQVNIDGLGIFKINQLTIEEFKTNFEIKTSIDISSNEYSNSDNVYELLPNKFDLNKSPIDASYCNESRVFKIKEYTISGIAVKNIKLTFYKNSLIDIHTDSSTELVKALETKYGEGKKEEIGKKTVSCRNKLTGISFEETESSFWTQWRNGFINARYSIGNYFDDNCKEKHLSYLSIKDETKTRQELTCDLDAEDKIKSNLEKAKKDSLSGL